MTRKPWKRVTINVSAEEYRTLCALSGLKQMSLAEFCRYLLSTHIKNNESLMPYIEKATEQSLS